MKTTKAFELEIMRHNVTPAQFLAYVRQQTKRKGISFDMSSADFTREGWSFGYMNALPSEKPCNAETGTDKPYNKHTYIRNFDGTTYNEIIEFQFDDDKTGFGYYYTVQIDVADEDREANTAETIAHTIANRAKKAEAQEARAAKIEAEADEAEARGYAAQWWIEAQRTEAAKLRREAAATREAITASNAQATAEAPETSEETESEEQTTAPTDAAELDNLKAIRDDITTDPNPDTIRAAQDAVNRHFIEIDPEDIDTPRKIRAALTDIINAIYWDIAEDITPRTTTTA